MRALSHELFGRCQPRRFLVWPARPAVGSQYVCTGGANSWLQVGRLRGAVCRRSSQQRRLGPDGRA
eukprot:11201793-Lingulodinium_polyedra.AAC.1